MTIKQQQKETFIHSQKLDEDSTLEQAENADTYAHYIPSCINPHSVKEKVQESIHQLTCLVQDCNDTNSLRTVNNHLQSAISVLKAAASHNLSQKIGLTPTVKFAPNSNHVTQTFYSTRKEVSLTRKRICKPSDEEKEESKSKMMKCSIKVCAKCWKEDDAPDGEEEINWVQCDACGLWLHATCATNYNSDSDSYFCYNCKNSH